MDIKVGATLSGGSTVTLSPSGISPGKSTFVGPGHTRLEPNTVEFTVSGGTGNTPVARTGVKITFANRMTEEGCCTVQEGSVIVDLGVRWSLNQPETLADSVIDYLQGIVFTDQFIDSVKKGILPSA